MSVPDLQVTPELRTAIQTLLGGGFILEGLQRQPGYALLHLQRPDEFGAIHNYELLLAEGRTITETEVEGASTVAKRHGAALVVIGQTSASITAIEWSRFLNLFGGPVQSADALEPEFVPQLMELGANKLPSGLQGRADDLFESYVKAGLEFILAGRVIRYGQERLFEARPDGIAIPKRGFIALYDAKAYRDGYPVTADSIRQFKSYVEEFRKRYADYLERLSSFIVVSGTFEQGDNALRERHAEFIAAASIPLTFMTAETFGKIIRFLADTPTMRRAIDWGRVFADPVVSADRVKAEIDTIRRDQIITRR